MNSRFRFARLIFIGLALIMVPSGASAQGPEARAVNPQVNLPGEIRGTHYESFTGGKPVTPSALFGKNGKPHGTEVKQGGSGDCYLDSTAAVYAEFHRPVIQKIFLKKDGGIRTSASGEAAARFFVKSHETGEFKPAKPAIYDGSVPVGNSGKPVFNKVVHDRLWASQLEIAFTKFRNAQGGSAEGTGFARTGNGGYASHVMRAFTGKDAELVNFSAADEDKVWNTLVDAQNANKVVVAGTVGNAELRGRAKDQAAHGMRLADAKPTAFDEEKWVSNHAYSVWGDKDHPFVFEKDGERFISLRNPWGTNAPGGKGKDGIGVIPFREFLLRYSVIYVGAPTSSD